MNRRTFVSSLAAAGVVAATSSSKLSATEGRPVYRVGLIGCGWFGGVDLVALASQAQIEVISLCDPNTKALTGTLEAVSKMQEKVPESFADFRKMLSSKYHDIVIVGTPDHWHALAGIEAMKSGADVLLEKPIGVDVIEGEALVAAARKYDRVVQVNMQRRSSPLCEEAREQYINSGRLGKISLVECYYYGGGSNVAIPSVDPPAHLDYEMWAGPAPKVPYIPPIESRGWRQFMEYGNGFIGDMGVHIFDMVRMLLDLRWPESICSTGGIYVYNKATSNRPDTQRAVFSYPDVDVSWEHRTWGRAPMVKRHWTDGWGARLIGDKGTLNITTLGYEFSPQGEGPIEGRHLCSKTNDLENLVFDDWGAIFNEGTAIHAANFLKACETRSRPSADIKEGHISSACCSLANIAMELGRPLSYNPKTRTVTDDKEATQRLSRAYRKPWIHPHPDNV